MTIDAGPADSLAPDDSPDSIRLMSIGAPIACPTCGSHTRSADTREGWACLDTACVWSAAGV